MAPISLFDSPTAATGAAVVAAIPSNFGGLLPGGEPSQQNLLAAAAGAAFGLPMGVGVGTLPAPAALPVTEPHLAPASASAGAAVVAATTAPAAMNTGAAAAVSAKKPKRDGAPRKKSVRKAVNLSGTVYIISAVHRTPALLLTMVFYLLPIRRAHSVLPLCRRGCSRTGDGGTP